jgi:hypothetical protein
MPISIIERFEPADNNRSGKIISFILWLNGGLLSEIMGSRQRMGLTASLAVSEEGKI